jgi:hypothetical protein
MLFFYLFALIPVIVGGILWIKNKAVIWQYWAISSGIAFALSGFMHIVAIHGQTSDIQTISGEIVEVRQFSAWTEFYEEAIYKTEYYTERESYTYTTGSGKNSRTRTGTRNVRKSRQVFSHWSPRTRFHSEHWKAYSNISTTYSIDKPKYLQIVKDFGGDNPVKGDRTTGEHSSRMIGGDPNDYLAQNKTGYTHPVTKLVTWENRVKAGPSTFSFRKLTKEQSKKIKNWPENHNPWVSDRVINTPGISFMNWDQMNARLGPVKKVNVIIVKAESSDEIELIQAKWIGGKKNDLVLAYCENGGIVNYTKVFGWTESEDVKSNLSEILLKNKIDDSIIPLIEKEIKSNYVIKDWSKFDYLTIEPPTWSYFVLVILMILIQGLLWYYFIYVQ